MNPAKIVKKLHFTKSWNRIELKLVLWERLRKTMKTPSTPHPEDIAVA